MVSTAGMTWAANLSLSFMEFRLRSIVGTPVVTQRQVGRESGRLHGRVDDVFDEKSASARPRPLPMRRCRMMAVWVCRWIARRVYVWKREGHASRSLSFRAT